jgi:hypothetical protein
VLAKRKQCSEALKVARGRSIYKQRKPSLKEGYLPTNARKCMLKIANKEKGASTHGLQWTVERPVRLCGVTEKLSGIA